eukprot:200775-Chlamydomonas_euryale.AAC.4
MQSSDGLVASAIEADATGCPAVRWTPSAVEATGLRLATTSRTRRAVHVGSPPTALTYETACFGRRATIPLAVLQHALNALDRESPCTTNLRHAPCPINCAPCAALCEHFTTSQRTVYRGRCTVCCAKCNCVPCLNALYTADNAHTLCTMH